MEAYSPLQRERLKFEPKIPSILTKPAQCAIEEGKEVSPEGEHADALKQHFPHIHKEPLLFFSEGESQNNSPLKVGVVFSGGQAAGGHNVVTGLFDSLKSIHSKSQLFGFLNGPKGICQNKQVEITNDRLKSYRNQGGFDLLGSGRDKIEKEADLISAKETAIALDLDGLVIIGGDDSNTNAAVLSEFFLKEKIKTKVIGVPKTIDGDLKNERIEISFGFDTAVKTYSESIGNLLRDALSAKKYTFFVKLMGRAASHIALECALQTHPNLTLISEEIAAKKRTLSEIVNKIADLIIEREKRGLTHGVILIPEGLIEFIPECQLLIRELNTLLAETSDHEKILQNLSKESRDCFSIIPRAIQQQLLMERDPHGNVQVSKIETERLLIQMVKEELKNRQFTGSFSPQPLFLGYEGRSALPSNFDAQYCTSLGATAALLLKEGKTGYMSSVNNLTRPIEEWQPCGVPLVSMMTIETRHGKPKPVIKKALVDLRGRPFSVFADLRDKWAIEDHYLYPGPIQFFGPESLTERFPLTLLYESESLLTD